MKDNIHPKYHKIIVKCNCGNQFQTQSTFESDIMHIDICNKCHPYYTGKQKIVDTAGRVEKYNRKSRKQNKE